MSARTTSTEDALFKEMYGSGDNMSLVNAKTPLYSMLRKKMRFDFVGKHFVQPVRFGTGVALGYRSRGQNLPAPSTVLREQAVFPAKRVYSTAAFDREAILASRNDKGAFAKVTVDDVAAAEEGFSIHMLERVLFGDGSGKLGQIADASITGAGTSASPWVFAMSTSGADAPKYKKKWFPKGAKMDLYTVGGVYQLTVEIVAASATEISAILVATGATAAPTDGDILYWEGNKGIEAVGLRSIAPVTPGTLYGINQTTNPEFKGLVKPITGTLDYGDLNEIVADLEEELESPQLAIGSHKALRLLKNQAEDQKRYNVAEAKAPTNVKVGFKGLEIMSDEGAFPLLASQMCPDDEIWLMKPEYLIPVAREDFGWFDDDGKMLLRDPNKDELHARYGGYFELFCSKPNTVAVIRGFTIPA